MYETTCITQTGSDDKKERAMQKTFSRPRYFGWAVALIVLAGFVLRVWQLGAASLWYDEAFTDLAMKASADRFLPLMLESSSAHVPLYFILLRLFPTDTEFLLRLPSAILGTAGILLLILVTVRLYGNYRLALMVGALLAFNPYHIWLSRTARPYALLFVLSLLASTFFLLLLRGERSRTNWIGFTLSSMAAYLTHYFAAALPLAQYILFAFILRGNRGLFRRWLRAQVVAGIPIVIWVIVLVRQGTVSLGLGWIPRPGLEDVPLTLWNMLLGYEGSLPWYLIPGLLAAALGLAPGLFYAVRERKTSRIDFYWFWLVTAPLITVFVLSLFCPLYVDRYFMVFLPALLLLVARGWQRLPRPAWGIILTAIVVVAGASNVVITRGRGDDQKEDWRSAAIYVEQERQPGDGLLLEDAVTLVAFLRYFDDEEMPRAWLLGGPELTEQYHTPVQRIWAIYRNPNEDGHTQGVLPKFDPFEPGASPMAHWLIERRDQVVIQKEFNGVTVLLVDVTAEFGGNVH
jgi:4-amino-4-deoxy-L-arabinose transferase-like glycosyltransferase